MSSPAAAAPAVRRIVRSAAVWAAGYRPAVALGGLVLTYTVLFGVLTWRHHAHFGTSAFDMGIYDQGLWLLSRFREPFVTVRGLNYFGHHANYTTVLLVPAYWLGAGPPFLYLVETIALALGAVPLWLLARARLESEWLAVGVAAAFLLHPSVGWINWWHFHPDALLITPLLLAYLFATRKQWGWFAVCAAAVALTKEDGALAVAAFGLLLLVRRAWRPGMATLAAGAAWFLMTTRLLIPRANGGLHPLYDELFPTYGSSFFEIAATVLSRPGQVLRDLTEHSRLWYAWQLVAPVAFVPLLGLPVLLLAAPQLTINALSAHEQTRDMHYHYSAVPVAALFVATVEGARRLHGRVVRRALVGAVVVASVATHAWWGASPLGQPFGDGVWAGPDDRAVASMRLAVGMVPADAAVSATTSMVPHLTHRPRVYLWPHPFTALEGYWGVEGSRPPDPPMVDYLVVDLADTYTYDVYPETQELFATLTAPSGPFEIVFQGDGVFVARRT